MRCAYICDRTACEHCRCRESNAFCLVADWSAHQTYDVLEHVFIKVGIFKKLDFVAVAVLAADRPGFTGLPVHVYSLARG
jgi:hypothetical protein